MSAISVIELFAGLSPDGNRVVERLPVLEQEDDSFVLVRSPAFVKGVAKGDRIRLSQNDHGVEILKRSGNLCVRVVVREGIEALLEDLAPPIEKLGGSLDFENERMIIFSIHVSCGFKQIEALLNEYVGEATHSAWFYGNVYDPEDGVRPLNWWQEILKQV